MREPLFLAALLRFAGPVPVSLKWAEVTDPTLRGRLSLPWPVGAGFSPGPLGDSLLAVKSPRPLPGQTETMSPDSRKPGGLPKPTSPAHRTGFFQHLPGAEVAQLFTSLDQVTPRQPKVTHFSYSGWLRSRGYFGILLGKRPFFWSVLCIFCVEFFFFSSVVFSLPISLWLAVSSPVF